VDPAVAVDGLGRAWVGWSGGAAGAELPYVATIAEGSSTVAAPAQLGSGAGRALRLAANSSGQGAATWVTAAGLSYADLRRNAAPSTGVLVPGAIAAADVGYSDSGAATVAYVPTGQAQVIIAHRPFGQGWTSVPVSAAANARPIVATRADNAVLVWGDSTGGPVQSANVDTTTPVSVHMTAPLKPFNLGTTIAAGWIGADGAGTLTYTVNVARAAYNTRLGAFTTWQQTTATDGAFAAGQGQTVCFQVAAADAAGNASATSSIRCTATPLDDRKLKRKKLHHAKVWRGGKEAGYFNGKGTYVEARKKGATLSLRGVKASRIALLVPRSRSYGTVQVSFGGKVLGKVNLAQKRKGVAKQQIVPVGGTFPLRQGGLKITVVSQKKVVRIDGIYAYGG
jgi:hypothetical protein